MGRRGFFVQAERDSLPPHALDKLVTRIRQLVTGDFHSIRFSALTAAPPKPEEVSRILALPGRGSAITRSDAFAVVVAKLDFKPLS
jgi:hypothetical protein